MPVPAALVVPTLWLHLSLQMRNGLSTKYRIHILFHHPLTSDNDHCQATKSWHNNHFVPKWVSLGKPRRCKYTRSTQPQRKWRWLKHEMGSRSSFLLNWDTRFTCKSCVPLLLVHSYHNTHYLHFPYWPTFTCVATWAGFHNFKPARISITESSIVGRTLS